MDKNMIVIDAGHGGSDCGAINSTGLKEKDINLQWALDLSEALKAEDIKHCLTRQDDRFISLEERVKICNALPAKAFLSIHCNGAANKEATGTEVWHYSDKTKGDAHILSLGISKALHLKNRGTKTGNFKVLRSTSCPAFLLELGFIESDAKVLQDEKARERGIMVLMDWVKTL